MGKRKLFCEYGPLCYQISLRKEWTLRRLRDFMSRERFAERRSEEPLPYVVRSHRSVLLRNLLGVDMRLQQNKAQNLRLAAAHLNGLIIAPGETFSFWRLVGRPTSKKGYLPGLVLMNGRTGQDVGGGLCQLANLIHWMELQSPLTTTELHHHTDQLFPDAGRRVPFGTGTSIFYNNVDYRFRNDTEETFQLLVWVEKEELCGELRCSRDLPCRWRIEERDHHFSREGDGYYRNSEIWQKVIRRSDGKLLSEKLILKNHSKVLYDPALIPPEELREETPVTG